MSQKTYRNQVAGKNPIQVVIPGHILKKTCKIELENYKTLGSTNPKIQAVVPYCCYVIEEGKVIPVGAEKCPLKCGEFNVEKLMNAAPEGHHVLMHDYADGMKMPCIADLKIGHRTWGDDKSDEKKKIMAQKDFETSSATLGIRLSGGFYNWGGKIHRIEKMDRGIFTDNELYGWLKKFFHFPTDKLFSALKQVEKITDAIRSSYGWRFIGASVLLLLDKSNVEMGSKKETVHVKLIDLAHTTNTGKSFEIDDGAVCGLLNLQKILKKVIESREGDEVSDEEDIENDIVQQLVEQVVLKEKSETETEIPDNE